MPSDDIYVYLFGFQEDRSVNVHYYSKPRHLTSQIDHLGKNEPSSEGFNTHLLGFQEDKWENIYFSE